MKSKLVASYSSVGEHVGSDGTIFSTGSIKGNGIPFSQWFAYPRSPIIISLSQSACKNVVLRSGRS